MTVPTIRSVKAGTDDHVSTPPSEVVDALEHDLSEVFAMSDDGRTVTGPPVTTHSVILTIRNFRQLNLLIPDGLRASVEHLSTSLELTLEAYFTLILCNFIAFMFINFISSERQGDG